MRLHIVTRLFSRKLRNESLSHAGSARRLSGTRRSAKNRPEKTGTHHMTMVAAVQYSGRPGSHSQPPNKSSTRLGSSRLRRRLSRIFTCEINEIGLEIMFP